MLLDFLSRQMEECDKLSMTEVQVYVAVTRVLEGNVSTQFHATKNGAHSGGVSSWPEPFKYLTDTKATLSAISYAIGDLFSTRQSSNEDETALATCIHQGAYHCGSIYYKCDKMTVNVYGLLQSIRTLLSHAFLETNLITR